MPPKVNTISVTLDKPQQIYITAKFPNEVKLGETMRCRSADAGLVEIYFDVNGSPFGSGKTEIDSNDPPLVLKVPGTFTGRCYFTTPDGVLHTYDPHPKNPRTTIPGGGDMIVR